MATLERREDEDLLDWFRCQDEAAVAAGEQCRRCKAYILFGARGYPRLCGDCERLSTSRDEVRHGKYVRCPKCGGSCDPYELRGDDVFSDGTHDVICPYCDHEFEVETTVSFSFTSPERIEDEPDPADDGDPEED